ncbi:MAG: type restriction endonuclease subunit [Verrucomicrobiales bacterium]|nr:type restriction endonuclease subunit [Verrucomicrobiales bacterium]
MAEGDLDQLAYWKYHQLAAAEIQTLATDSKWFASLTASVHGELDSISQTLTSRIRTLANCYATPLPELEMEVTNLPAKVKEHLKKVVVPA